MATTKKQILKKWIDLNDPNGAKLKVGVINQKLVLLITGVRPRSPIFHRTISELGFTPSKSGAFLAKAVNLTDKVLAAHFHRIWPKAALREMDISEFRMDLQAIIDRNRRKQEKAQVEVDGDDEAAMVESIMEVINRATYLGRNRQGERVFHSAAGRFLVDETVTPPKIIEESPSFAAPLFLRGNTQTEVRECAKGLLRACEKGESQNKDALLRFAGTVLQKEIDYLTPSELELIAQAIDSAVLENLVENNESASQAWADASYYQEMMPGRASFVPDSVTTPFLPSPIAVQVQRFLSSANTVTVTGKIPGYGFGLLPESTQVFVDDPDTLEWGNQSYHRPVVDAAATQDIPADGAYWRISGSPSREQVQEHFANLSDSAVSVITAGSTDVLPMLEAHASVIQTIKVPTWLAGTEKPIFVFVMKKGEVPETIEGEEAAQQSGPNRKIPQVNSWDDMKTLVDETLLRLGKVQEASDNKESKHRTENRYQRPYIAFSKTGPASTMVPKNLQAALGFALSRIEEVHGDIDTFVSDELGIGFETLQANFSPEQIDAMALAVNRIHTGRGFILGDETGIGKGRTIAGIATWANKQNKRVIFITDRSNLFSDLARDLIDIGEWERFRPLITNADGRILNIMGDAEELASPVSPAELKRIMEMNPADVNANIIFTTYSQMNTDNSAKGKWLRELCKESLVICDEAHIAAGSDSNIARQIQDMVDTSWGVLYASATWAKSSKNLHIFSRALPESVNITQVITSMKENGELFGEIFSSMLAMDGAFIRREHDLSKIDFVVDMDDRFTDRNTQVIGQVSEILGMLALLSGEINHALQRLNSDALNSLKAAREARQVIEHESQANEVSDTAEQSSQIRLPSKVELFSSSFGSGSAIYQVMRRTLAALITDYTAEKAIQSAKEGRRPVIVFEETGEAFVRQFINDEIERIRVDIANLREREAQGESTEADRVTREIADLLDAGAKPSDIVSVIRIPTIQDMMRGLLLRLGGVKVVELDAMESSDEPKEEGGVAKMVAHQSLAAIPGIDEALIENYMNGIETIKEKIDALPQMPVLPVDVLRNKFEKAGLTMGEISGRNFELHPAGDAEWTNDAPSYGRLVKRARKKSDVTQTVKAFNSAKIDILAINKAAATGLSVHSSPRFPDSRQREMFEMQADENPTNRIQLFGRVNRFDQVVPPRISMMSTGLKGEMRTIMTQNRKLTTLSANIRSSRDNAALIEEVPDLLNKMGDKVCQEYLLENPGIAGRLDIPMHKLKYSTGVAQAMTQRIALLSPRDQEKVYDDLIMAYEDAVIENEMAASAETIVTRNWRAKTVRQSIAWGPTEHVESLSAFDSPVFQRQVEYEHDYQPLHWPEIRAQISEGTQRLSADSRIKPLKIKSVVDVEFAMFDSALNLELRQPKEVQDNMWATAVLNAMVMSLPRDALESDDTDGNDDFPIFVDEAADNADGQARELELPKLKAKPKKGFAAIASHWTAIEARVPGTNKLNRMMALISPSGKTAKMWFPDDSSPTARQFLINLDRAIEGGEDDVYRAIKEIEPIQGVTEESWIRNRFNKTWGSLDPQVQLLDFSALTASAVRVMEAKKIIALPQTGKDSIESAMADSEHNAVKEAHFRQAFIAKVLPKLTPGTQFWISTREKNQRFSDFFGERGMIVVDVKPPAPGHESVLSNWKFTVLRPGDEKPTTMSGSLLFKLAGNPPLFNYIATGRNVFEGKPQDLVRAAEGFNLYKKGKVVRHKTLLVGNMFQAGEWARESKKGKPIIYTDEAGQGHRAIEVDRFQFDRSTMKFPVRLHERETIKDFFSMVMAPVGEGVNAPALPPTHTIFTSFKGALGAEKESRSTDDMMLIDPSSKMIAWVIDKGEKNRVTRSLRNAVKADEAQWKIDFPDTEYPVKFSTKASRSSTDKTELLIKMPETQEGRDRFLDIFIKTQGLQLFVRESLAGAYLHRFARQAERRYYERLAQPSLEDRARKEQERERRTAMRAMMSSAFGTETQEQGAEPVEGESSVPVESPEHSQDDASTAPEALEQRSNQTPSCV